VRQLREATGMTQREMAEALQISHSTYEGYERRVILQPLIKNSIVV